MNESPKTRNSLILRLTSQGDAEAWQQFCQIYEPLILQIARNRGLQNADAHDLAQDAFIKIAKSIQRFEPNAEKGSFRGWISTIARNLTIDFMRQKNRATTFTQELISREAFERSAESDFYDREFEKQMFLWAAEEIRSTFSESSWQAFWKTAVDGQSVTDVAQSLGLSKGAVYIARSRVIAKLRNKVEQVSGCQLPSRGDQDTETNQ